MVPWCRRDCIVKKIDGGRIIGRSGVGGGCRFTREIGKGYQKGNADDFEAFSERWNVYLPWDNGELSDIGETAGICGTRCYG